MLQDLNRLFNEIRKTYREGASTADVALTPEFQRMYQRVLAKENSGFSVEFNKYSAVVTTAKGKKIFVPNQWFTQAVWWTPYVKAFDKYRRLALAAYEKAKEFEGFQVPPKEDAEHFFMDYRDKKLAKERVDIFKKGLLETIKETGSRDPETDFSYMEKALEDYGWWQGGRSIARGEAYKSSVLRTVNVQAESSGFFGNIVDQISSDADLEKAAWDMVKAPSVKVEAEDNSDTTDERVTGGVNHIVYGAPGTGKNFYVDQKYKNTATTRRVVFHPEYTSYDFVGSYKPVSLYRKTTGYVFERSGEPFNLGEPLIDYRFVPGPFTDAVVDAWLNPGQMHTLIIEEINRSEASAVFAEVFQLLDRKENGESRYALEPSHELKQYLLSIQGLDTFLEDGFRIPSNLNLIATMNSADQGVKAMDSAFKRRWSFEYLPISVDTAVHRDQKIRYNGTDVAWGDFILALNSKLADHRIEEDRLIGPYFITPEEVGRSQATDKLLLYLWDDVLRHTRSSFFHEKVRNFSELSGLFEEMDVLDLEKDPYLSVLHPKKNPEEIETENDPDMPD